VQKSVVLLSSGLDSTVNLFEAKEKSDVAMALTFDYGQRASIRETDRAAQIARIAKVRHQIVSLPWFSLFTNTSLINRAHDVPVRADISIDEKGMSQASAKAVWVPNRNGIFLNIAAAFAEGLKADWVVPGFNLEEAATFPDNTQEFLDKLTDAFRFSTATHVQAMCFTTGLDKTQIVRRGRELKVPFDLMWPCYLAGDAPCGECESCQRFTRAQRDA
jgi:7-cyano-7-deazaguanine synthase